MSTSTTGSGGRIGATAGAIATGGDDYADSERSVISARSASRSLAGPALSVAAAFLLSARGPKTIRKRAEIPFCVEQRFEPRGRSRVCGGTQHDRRRQRRSELRQSPPQT
jgi:hypothetical protein